MEGLYTYQLSGSKPRTMHPINNNYNINHYNNNYNYNNYNYNYYNYYNNYNHHNNYNNHNNSYNYNNNYNHNNNNSFALRPRLYRNNLKMFESFSWTNNLAWSPYLLCC